jgi:hypothetical protein
MFNVMPTPTTLAPTQPAVVADAKKGKGSKPAPPVFLKITMSDVLISSY